MAHNAELGRRGEQLAVDHLEARGMRVIERNWRCRLGEIDLVARDGDDTVFVEVKTRTTADYGHPFESITPVKLARLRRLQCVRPVPTPSAPARSTTPPSAGAWRWDSAACC